MAEKELSKQMWNKIKGGLKEAFDGSKTAPSEISKDHNYLQLPLTWACIMTHKNDTHKHT